ncbi:hypothetical protein EIP86_005726 [Pleurotus ostreatoroseus]|nr:hypothetical protein EIP86_005726 [Pleurotus ostreatoroseus]
MSHLTLDTILPSVTAEHFFKTYVSKRTPVVIKGLPDDEAFKARQWVSYSYLAYLEQKSGDSEVLVEPMHPVAHQFGTAVERVPMTFKDFLKSLRSAGNEEKAHPYLTTQYAAQGAEEDSLTMLPPPANTLEEDFPRVPRLMGNLFLQQVNLWLGKSKDGATSGLHHDFHDNLYCLLKGKKRFVLFPPKEHEHLYPYGTLHTFHPNGLISYTDAPVRSDGLPYSTALKARVRALEAKLETMPNGKGKKRENTKERQALLDAHEAALDELAQHALEGVDGVVLEDMEDDFDALMAGMDEGDEEGLPTGLAAPGEEEEDDSEEEEEGGETLASGEEDQDQDDEGAEPSSFSRIPTAFVHQHLQLPTTAVPPLDLSLDDFPDLKKASTPYVVELNAGEMLYLPASWWHEVTSSSAGESADAVHMAFNYWFYPPNQFEKFEEPYEDTLVWDYFRERDGKRGEDEANKRQKSNGKRKARDPVVPTSKKARRS